MGGGAALAAGTQCWGTAEAEGMHSLCAGGSQRGEGSVPVSRQPNPPCWPCPMSLDVPSPDQGMASHGTGSRESSINSRRILILTGGGRTIVYPAFVNQFVSLCDPKMKLKGSVYIAELSSAPAGKALWWRINGAADRFVSKICAYFPSKGFV